MLRENPSPYPEKRSAMSYSAEAVCDEMQGHVSRLVSLSPGESRKAAIRFAAGILHLPYSRVKRLFYGEARRIEAHEADQIRAYVEAATRLIEARGEYERQRQQFLSAHPTLARLAPGPVGGTDVQAAAEEAPLTAARGR